MHFSILHILRYLLKILVVAQFISSTHECVSMCVSAGVLCVSCIHTGCPLCVCIVGAIGDARCAKLQLQLCGIRFGSVLSPLWGRRTIKMEKFFPFFLFFFGL